jgi:hypothetical protein
MKFWNDVKKYVIKSRGLDATATDAEVHQAALDAQAEESPDDATDGDSNATQTPKADAPIAPTTPASAEATPETVSVAEFNALKAELASTKTALTTLAKTSKPAVSATTTATTATESVKKRAYMTTPLNKGLYEDK